MKAGAAPGDCWDQISFPGKCSSQGNRKCFKEMISRNQTQRFLRCDCHNWDDDEEEPRSKPRKEVHIYNCKRANPKNCTFQSKKF